jgi:NDP-sugar pyrophosphorylase family protein
VSRNVVAIGIFGGFGRNQNVVGRREPLHPSRIKNPFFINVNAAPKPLMPIATVPISRIFIEKIRAIGIDEIYATTHYLHDLFNGYYLEGAGKGMINNLWYEKVSLGTAPGVIMNIMIRSWLRNKTVLIFAGDILTNMDIGKALKYHREAGSKCTVALNSVPAWDVTRFGTALFVQADGPLGEVKEFREKKSVQDALRSVIGGQKLFLNNSSLYIFEPEIFLTPITFYSPSGASLGKTTILEKMFPQIDREFLKQLKAGKIEARTPEQAESHLARFGPPDHKFSDFGFHLFPQLARNGLMKGHYFNEYWNDIKTNDIYWFANWDALSGRLRMNIPFPEYAPGIWRHPSSEVIDMRSIEPPVVIGPNVRIDVNTKVGPFVIIDRDWELEKGVRISYSILWPRYAGMNRYPETRRYQVALSGATIEKSIVAGALPVGDHLHRIVMADSRAGTTNLLSVRSLTPLDIPPGSEAAVAKQTKRVLIVDNSRGHVKRMRKVLGKKGWGWIETATDYNEASGMLSSERYDLIILDSNLATSGKSKFPKGVKLLKDQKLDLDAKNHETPVLLWRYGKDIPGLTSEEVEHLTRKLGVISRDRNNKDMVPSRLSDFLLKELLGIDPTSY